MSLILLGRSHAVGVHFSDLFTGTTPLESHTPDTGDAWGSGSDNTDWSTSSGVLTQDVSGIRLAYNPTEWTSADYWVEAVVRTVGASSNDRVGILARGGGEAWSATHDYGDGYLARIGGDGNLYLQADGSYKGGAYSIPSFDPSTWYTLRLEVSGTDLTVKLDGTVVKTATDSSIARTGYVGLYARNGNIEIDSLEADYL